MSGFTDRFGGSQLQASQVAISIVPLTSNLVTYWPPYANSVNVLARIMDVTPASAGLAINLPDATQSAAGMDVSVRNLGSFSFLIKDYLGNTLYVVLPGQFIYFYLRDTSVPAGTWGSLVMGIGTSTLDLAAAAGAGLVPTGTGLAVSPIVSEVSGNTTISLADRAKLYIWKGGTGAFTLPLSSSVGQFFFEVRNSGSGALTLSCSGGEIIDGSNTLILQVGEACFVHAGTASWVTVGRGRATSFAFTQLQKTVTGGTVVLSLTEAANVVQTYLGTLTSNVDIVVPAVVQVYYISNQTSGAFNFRVKNPGSGSTVSLPSGQNAILFSDGTNVTNSATTVAGIGAILFGPGSAAVPSVGIGGTTTGLYSANTGEVSVTSNGVKVAAIDAAGIRATGAGAGIGIFSTAGTATLTIDKPAGSGGYVQLSTATAPRFIFGTAASAEPGGNVGSDFFVNRYSDAGTFIDSPFSINRATGATRMLSVRDVSAIGQIVTFACDSTYVPANCLFLSGALLNRASYPELFAYANATGLVSEATWSAGSWGKFSVGDGSTTFRIPDTRGMHIRVLDAGRGVDAGRAWGTDQAAQNATHNHGMSDPGHSHTVNDPGHIHGVNDPSHAHSIADPGHAHVIPSNYMSNNLAGGAFNPVGAAPYGVGGVTAAAGTGIGIYGAATGISIYTGYAGTYLSGAFTGVSTQNSGGADARPRNIAYPQYIRYQ